MLDGYHKAVTELLTRNPLYSTCVRVLKHCSSMNGAWIEPEAHKSKDSASRFDVRVAFVDDARFYILVDCVDEMSYQTSDTEAAVRSF